jgi:hypothetical protein
MRPDEDIRLEHGDYEYAICCRSCTGLVRQRLEEVLTVARRAVASARICSLSMTVLAAVSARGRRWIEAVRYRPLNG